MKSLGIMTVNEAHVPDCLQHGLTQSHGSFEGQVIVNLYVSVDETGLILELS